VIPAPKDVLAPRLVAAREAADKKKKKTQSDIAAACGVSQPLMCAWEDPKDPRIPHARYWEAIAREVNVSVEDLFLVPDEDERKAAGG
jgi:transcriptional regulator with XRE-family HTH domain